MQRNRGALRVRSGGLTRSRPGKRIPPGNGVTHPVTGSAGFRRAYRPPFSRQGAVRRMRTSLRYPYPSFQSGSEKAAPLGKSGGAGMLVGIAVLEVALRRKVVVDRGMD